MLLYIKITFTRFLCVKKERRVNAFYMSADPPAYAPDRASAERSALAKLIKFWQLQIILINIL